MVGPTMSWESRSCIKVRRPVKSFLKSQNIFVSEADIFDSSLGNVVQLRESNNDGGR